MMKHIRSLFYRRRVEWRMRDAVNRNRAPLLHCYSWLLDLERLLF
jgi:hypothetical protein